MLRLDDNDGVVAVVLVPGLHPRTGLMRRRGVPWMQAVRLPTIPRENRGRTERGIWTRLVRVA
jgi:hypothetical protein